MKPCIFPSVHGIPRLAMIGPSAASKSTMAYNMLAKELREIINNIIGPTTGQHTIIKTNFLGDEDFKDPTTVKLRISLKKEFDSDELLSALDFNLRNFVSRSNSSGIPLSNLKKYVSELKFVENLLTEVNGTVRLEKLRSDEFSNLLQHCVLSLLDNFNTSVVDADIAKMKNDKQQNDTKLVSFSNQLRVLWDKELKTEKSPTEQFVNYIKSEIMYKLSNTVPLEEYQKDNQISCEIDLKNDLDKESLRKLLDPYEPFSIIVKEYEIAHGFSDQLLSILKIRTNERIGPNKILPFRVVLVDNPGLTQDSNATEYNMKKRLKTALNCDIDGILLMLPTNSFDAITQAMKNLFSNQSEEGRQIRQSKIQIHAAITRADEKVTPNSDVDYDQDTYISEMNNIYMSLKSLEESAIQNFSAKTAKCVTNQYKKVKAYLNDLKEHGQEELANNFDILLANHSGLNYLFEIVSDLQKQIFSFNSSFSSNAEPIILKSVANNIEEQHFKVDLISDNFAKEAAKDIADSSKSYHFDEWLHWVTAFAFRDSVINGTKFVSKAMIHGRINIYIDGDVLNAINRKWINQTCNFTIRNVDFSHERSSSLLRALGISSDNVDENVIENSLKDFFFQNFTDTSLWRFYRAMSRTVRRLSYQEPWIMKRVDDAFREAYWKLDGDASTAVYNMLHEYKKIYQSDDFYQTIIEVMNDELTKEFNKLFYVVYS
ncbi:hypothetical protein [Paenibacillus sp. FSL K6-2524]|uniref:hypothetical protein n=1 Tax=Paenibacillus sp. FSL K6-2524 TaxID=2954516 RepID=UPI0030FB83C0